MVEVGYFFFVFTYFYFSLTSRGSQTGTKQFVLLWSSPQLFKGNQRKYLRVFNIIYLHRL